MMTEDQARDRALRMIEAAMRQGADAADVVVSADASVDVSVRLGKLEDVGRSESADIGLRVFIGRRSASVSTADLGDAAATEMVARAVAMARQAPEDTWAGLAPADRLLTGPAPNLELDDGGDVAPALLKERALEAEDAARAVPGVTNSEGGGASAARGITALATSHGFAGAYTAASHMISASVLAGEGGAMARDGAHHTARHFADLEAPVVVGARAGARAVARRDSGRAPSGVMPVVFDPRIGGSLIGHLLGAIAGPAIAARTSFLRDALGTPVFAPGITIAEDPLRPRGLRTRPFDGEGLAVVPRAIVEDGVLQTWLLNSASARQLGLAPTGHAARHGVGAPGVSASNLHLAPGSIARDALIGSVARGVYITELFGTGVNGVTGDYSRGAAGFLIEHGRLTRPVSEFTIAGNLKAMFAALTAADDLEFRYGINVPTLLVAGMMVASG